MGARILLGVALAVAAAYVALVVFVYVNQRRLLYFPTHADRNGKGSPRLRPWRDPRGDLLGYCREPIGTPSRAVLFFHGNGGEALDRDWFTDVVPPGAVLCLAEYPGYGARKGEPTEAALFEAALGQFDALVSRWPVPVTVVGESLGSGVACYLASQRPVARVALVTPFSSAADVAQATYPFLPARLLLKDKYLSLVRAPALSAPLHVIHGTADDIIPLALARRLFDAWGGKPKVFTEVPGAGHNDIYGPILRSPIASSFRAFLTE